MGFISSIIIGCQVGYISATIGSTLSNFFPSPCFSAFSSNVAITPRNHGCPSLAKKKKKMVALQHHRRLQSFRQTSHHSKQTLPTQSSQIPLKRMYEHRDNNNFTMNTFVPTSPATSPAGSRFETSRRSS